MTAATPSPEAPLRLGFAGCGMIGRAQADRLAGLPATVVCACDPSPEALRAFGAKHAGARLYPSLAAMLAAEAGRLDALSVCTPNSTHAANAIAGLDAGLHVLVEKPMAMSSAECRTMLAAAGRAGRRLVVGFQWRFDARVQALRRLIAAGAFGRILHVRVQALRRRGIPNWGVFGRKELQGGGPLIDIGVHVCEMVHYAIGSPQPVAASGSCWTYLGDKPMQAQCEAPDWDWRTYTVEDLATGQVRFAGGTTMAIESSFAAHIEQDVWNFQVMGERGGCTYDPFRIFTDRDGHMWNETPLVFGAQDWNAVLAEKMRHFVAVCRGEGENLSPGEDGLKVQQILDGIYASSVAGREVAIS